VGLLTDQIEFADVIVLSKVDLVDKETVGTIRGIVAKLNPYARIIEAVKGDIPLDQILNTGLFDFDKASQNVGWLKEMRGEHTPETEEYGISSFVYESKKPFDRQKLMELLQNGTLQGVVRSKGFAWDNSDLTTALLWSQAGNIINLDPYGYWSKSKSGESQGEQKIVFIGANMDKQSIIEALDKCLVI
jgi:G3E family GTPase